MKFKWVIFSVLLWVIIGGIFISRYRTRHDVEKIIEYRNSLLLQYSDNSVKDKLLVLEKYLQNNKNKFLIKSYEVTSNSIVITFYNGLTTVIDFTDNGVD